MLEKSQITKAIVKSNLTTIDEDERTHNFAQYITRCGGAVDDGPRWKYISKNHFPANAAISTYFAIERLKFMDVDQSADNIACAEREINTDRTTLTSYIKSLTLKYFLERCEHHDLKYGRPVRHKCKTIKNMLKSIGHVKDRDGMRPWVYVLYLDWEHPLLDSDWKKNVAECALFQAKMIIRDEKEDTNVNCVVRLISQIMSETRKGLNDKAFDDVGYQTTISRTREMVEESNANGEEWRRPKYFFFDWMIVGNGVSIIL